MTEIYPSAIRMLASREHSCFELKQKLLQRDFSLVLINQTIEKLISQNLICDKRFTECYIRSRSAKGFGPLRISQELQAKGISKELVTLYLRQNKPSLDDLKKVRIKKFGSELPKNLSDRAKQTRYLQYKGFSLEEINKELGS